MKKYHISLMLHIFLLKYRMKTKMVGRIINRISSNWLVRYINPRELFYQEKENSYSADEESLDDFIHFFCKGTYLPPHVCTLQYLQVWFSDKVCISPCICLVALLLFPLRWSCNIGLLKDHPQMFLNPTYSFQE